MRSMLCATVALLAGCLPPISSAEGRACDDPHPCPDALFCVEGVCRAEQAAPTPTVRQIFADDCEAMASWVLIGSSRLVVPAQPAHGGLASCRLQAGDSPITSFGIESQPLAVQDGTYCVTGFFAQGATSARANLVIRRYGGPQGTTLVEESPPLAASTLLANAGAAFTRLSASLPVSLATTSSVKIGLSVEARLGAAILFDDLVVTHSTALDAGCP